MTNPLLIALLIGPSLVLSFLFSGMEAGVLALSRLRIRQLMRAGNKRAQVLHSFLEQPEDFLWTILIGNTLANFTAVGVLVVWLYRWLVHREALFILAFLALMFLYYTFFELLPKMLFRLFPNRLCLVLARPFRMIHLVLGPIVALVTTLTRGISRWTGDRTFTGHLFGTREEMRLVMQESAEGLTSEERVMINRVLDLQNVTVKSITIPLREVASLNSGMPMTEALKLAQGRRVSRLPVWRNEGNQQRIVGILSLRTLLYQADLDLNRTVGDYVKPALFLEETLLLEGALQRMQKSGQRLAIVLGPGHREVGIVGLQDILRAIFGEVRL